MTWNRIFLTNFNQSPLRRVFSALLATYKRALGQWGFCPAGFFIFDFLFLLSGGWVKATRSVP
jgi:hypothetical protein